MRRARYTLALLALLAPSALAWGVPASATAASTKGCAGQTPRDLHLTRIGGPRARLSWKAPAAAAAGITYRVQRSGRTVGQTTHGSIVLRVTPGRVTTFSVQARGGVDAGHGCWSKVRSKILFRGPGRVAGVRVLSHGGGKIALAWHTAARGDAPLAGYRIVRDAAVVGQTHARSYALKISSGRAHRVSVSAVDTRGHLGPASAALVIGAGGQVSGGGAGAGPSTPAGVSAAEVSEQGATIVWLPSKADGSRIVGYRVYRDGRLVGQSTGSSMRLVHLAYPHTYAIAVSAIDAAKHESPRSAPLSLSTTHTPPSAPGTLSASSVTSQSVQLNWSPSSAVSGNIVGYRVFRDGEPVGQIADPTMTLSNLAPSTDYKVSVVAVDSLGAISEPTPALTVHTADPTPTTGTAQAFLLASTDQSFHDLEAHYQQVGVVYPTYFECGNGGEVTGKDDPLVTGWSEARQIEVMPRLNCQNSGREAQLLNDPSQRAKLVDNLAKLCQTYGYEGIQVDFEGADPSERNPFTAFITLLAEKLHSQGDKVSTIVTAKYYNVPTGRAAMYDDAALSVPSDYIFVLDWGIHWTTSGPGSLDEYPWFKRVAEYTATMPHLNKFVLGMPMYGIDWANGGGPGNPGTPLEYEDIVALETVFGALPEWDATALSPHFSYKDGSGVRHDLWFTNQQSIGARMQLAQSLGLGIGLWHLGSEDQSVWSLPQIAAG